MKKRIFTILLSLCMALLIFPVTSYAEGPEPITSFNINVRVPIVGEHLQFGCSLLSIPDVVQNIDPFSVFEWYEISKEATDDSWVKIENTNADYTFKEDYKYKFVCTFEIEDELKEQYDISSETKVTLNGESCDSQIAADGKSCKLSKVFDAIIPQPIKEIAATIKDPVLGEKPDYNPQFTVDPKGSVKLEECRWYKISQDKYTGKDIDKWDEVENDDVFEVGYYYAVDLYFTPVTIQYTINDDISATLNEKPHDDTYGSANRTYIVYLSGVFGPLETQYTLSVPFTTTVKQGGNVAPGKTDFKLELVNFEGQKISNDDVKVTAFVNTNGKGSYKGNMTITGTLDEIMSLFDGKLFVKQVDEGKENWTYDDTVWGLVSLVELSVDDDLENVFDVHILPTICEKTENGMFYQIEDGAYEVDSMSFTNTYTKSVSVTTKPTDPTKDNSNTGTKKNVETGDSSNLALWFALLAVSTVGVIGTTVYNKRRRNTQSK